MKPPTLETLNGRVENGGKENQLVEQQSITNPGQFLTTN